MNNFLNNRALSALMISSIALTTVACANQNSNDENQLPEPSISSETPDKKPDHSKKPDKSAEKGSGRKDVKNNDTNTSSNTSLSNQDTQSDAKPQPYVNYADPYSSKNSQPSTYPAQGAGLPLLQAGNAEPLPVDNETVAESQGSLYKPADEKSNQGTGAEDSAQKPTQPAETADEPATDTSPDTTVDPVEDLDQHTEDDNATIEIPKVNSEDSFNKLYTQWKEKKDEAESRLQDADHAVEEATRVLHDQMAKNDELVARVNEAQAAFDKANFDYEKALEAQQLDVAEAEAMLQKNLATAKQDLSNAKVAAENAKTALIKAQEDVSRVQADKAKVTAKLEAINTGIDSLDKRIEANNAEMAKLENQKVPATRTNFTANEYQTLVAQAVIEMVNAYRAENGVSPLRTHDVYNYSAHAWSQQMAMDGKNVPASEFGDAFRHSPDTWGASGENIAGMYTGHPDSLDKADWAHVSKELFNMWRNSPGHNEAMLATQSQGIGVGVVTDENGRVWATTQFFKEDTQFTSGARVNMDKGTRHALDSGKDFYVAEGAMDVLGVEWSVPKDTNGATPSYQYIMNGRASQEAKLQGLSHGIDDSVQLTTGGVSGSQRAQIDSQIAQLNDSNSKLLAQKHDALGKKHGIESELDKFSRAEELADSRVTNAENDLTQAQENVVKAEEKVVEAQSAVDSGVAEAVPSELKAVRDSAEQALESAKGQLSDSEVGVADAQQDLTDALLERSNAQAGYATVVAQEPVQDASTDSASTVGEEPEEESLSFDD